MRSAARSLRALGARADVAWRAPRPALPPAEAPAEPPAEPLGVERGGVGDSSAEGVVEVNSGPQGQRQDVEAVDEQPAPKWFSITFQLVMLALMVLFLFLLLVWSRVLNDWFEVYGTLCTTPAEMLTCGNGESYVDIARQHGWVHNGSFVGCGCEDGILGDSACAVNHRSFSVSYFISTAPGTGAMAAFTGFPIVASWTVGLGNPARFGRHCSRPVAPTSVAYTTLKVTHIAFQIFYGLFLINTLCVWASLRFIAVLLFIVSEVVHLCTLAVVVGAKTTAGILIWVVVAVGLAGVIGGLCVPPGPSWFGQHAFFLGECIGLTCMFLTTPILSLVPPPDVPKKPN